MFLLLGARERGSAGLFRCIAEFAELKGENEVCLRRDSLLGFGASKVIPASIKSS